MVTKALMTFTGAARTRPHRRRLREQHVSRGGPDDDVFGNGPGNETIRGGRGLDAASYILIHHPDGNDEYSCNDITADLSAGTAAGDGFGTDILHGIEGVRTGGGNDTLIGDEGPNEFYTGRTFFAWTSPRRPKQSLATEGSTTSLDAWRLEGGASVGPVDVDLRAQVAHWDAHGPNPVLLTLLSIENVTGTVNDDLIFGDDGPNVLIGLSGNDSVTGHGGDDSLLGNKGNDTLDGGPGANTNDGGKGTDTCINPSPGAQAVNREN